MTAFTFPHCRQRGITVWRKLVLGWGRAVPCQYCGLKITVSPLPTVAAMLPVALIVLAIGTGWLRDPAAMILLGLLAWISYALLHLYVVPLSRAGITWKAAVEQAHEKHRRAAARFLREIEFEEFAAHGFNLFGDFEAGVKGLDDGTERVRRADGGQSGNTGAMMRTCAGGTLPAAVICPVKKRPKAFAASITAR